jgi:hypothetical protein
MKHIGYIIAGTFIVLTVVAGYLFFEEKKKAEAAYEIIEQAAGDKMNLYVSKKYRETEMHINGRKIDLENRIFDKKGLPLTWDDLINDNKLVLYFPEGSCNECVNAAINAINKQCDSIDQENVIVFINAVSKRYVAQYRINSNLPYQIYEMRFNNEDFFPMNQPCLFVIEKESKRINSFYLPQKEKPEEIDKYLNTIMKHYF